MCCPLVEGNGKAMVVLLRAPFRRFDFCHYYHISIFIFSYRNCLAPYYIALKYLVRFESAEDEVIVVTFQLDILPKDDENMDVNNWNVTVINCADKFFFKYSKESEEIMKLSDLCDFKFWSNR